jgi:ribosomal protein L4
VTVPKKKLRLALRSGSPGNMETRLPAIVNHVAAQQGRTKALNQVLQGYREA